MICWRRETIYGDLGLCDPQSAMHFERREMSKYVANRMASYDKTEVDAILTIFIDQLQFALINGHSVTIRGIGTFERAWKPPRRHNKPDVEPGTPTKGTLTKFKSMVFPGHYRLKFTPSVTFNDRLRQIPERKAKVQT